MIAAEQTRSIVDTWIAEEEIPVSACLKVIRSNDPTFGFTEDEIQERNEVIHWYLFQDYLPLMMVPKQAAENDFFIPDCDVDSPEYSAFNSYDFQRTQRPFDRYGYAMKKIMERVKDLAIMHSCISQPENQQQVYERFKSFMALKFIDEVEELAMQLHTETSYAEQEQVKRRIETLSREIRRCMKIWAQYAPTDNWDR